MIRALFFLSLALTAAACNKPSESDCRKAIANMQALLHTDKLNQTSDNEASVRRCRGNSTKQSVQCAMEAQDLEGLKKCGLVAEPAPAK